ncbi:SDR family NAD(P)-dependent oxidoreductase [Streptomyces mirabilis]|uniref:SDR family NAD(P)-dependent oxidoreductase n=1 Tax=Streptomyces mirabilis TaxID=68239 RepID=UPI00365D2176
MSSKVALVTGASSGIGEVTALKLQELGYTVYGAARRVERMSRLAEAGVHVLPMDVTDTPTRSATARRSSTRRTC